jgi:hypothetical protein
LFAAVSHHSFSNNRRWSHAGSPGDLRMIIGLHSCPVIFQDGDRVELLE